MTNLEVKTLSYCSSIKLLDRHDTFTASPTRIEQLSTKDRENYYRTERLMQRLKLRPPSKTKQQSQQQ
jgi:hypothetical protein